MATLTLDNPPSIDAGELHEILLRTHTAGNIARRRFIDSLRALHESKLHRQLGFPSITAYADRVFRYSRSQTFDFVRVSRALLDLPRIAAAFDRGEIPYALVSKLTRVAGGATEGEWLDLATREDTAALSFAIEVARKMNRKAPAKGRFGLPGTPVKIAFELAPEEHAIVEKALRKAAGEAGESLDGAVLPAKDALVYLCQRILETGNGASITAGREAR